MSSPALRVLVRFLMAAIAVWVLREGLAGSPGPPPVWLATVASFGLAKFVGDVGLLAFFRHSVVVFYEDLFWEMAAFLLLGVLAGGLIVIAEKFIGGAVDPYLPALGVYLVFLLAEGRQSGSPDRG